MDCRTRIRLALAVTALWLVTIACSFGRVEMVSPYQDAIAEEQPGRVYLTLSNGEELSLRSPVVRQDTVIGTTLNRRTNRYTDTVRVAVADVDLIKRDGEPSTAEYIVGGALGAAGLVLMIIYAQDPFVSN